MGLKDLCEGAGSLDDGGKIGEMGLEDLLSQMAIAKNAKKE